MRPSRPAAAAPRRLALPLAAAWLAVLVTASGAQAAPGDQAVAYQVSPAHDGNATNAGLAAPLTGQWSVTLPAAASYPLIVNGMVFVTAANQTLYALSQATGATLWSHALGGNLAWSGVAYDRGQLFAVNSSGLVTVFDPATGTTNWSRQLGGQSLFDSAPTAANGIVYVSHDTLDALRERDGHLLWSQPVNGGDTSSPAVDAQAVYVTYACQQDFAFGLRTGALLWHPPSNCSGGGGHTPVVGAGTVFARDAVVGNRLLATATGATLGSFNAGPVPAVAGTVAYTLGGSTLSAVTAAGLGTNAWQFTGDGGLDSAPLVAGGLVFVGSSTGELYALDTGTGATTWSTNVGSPIPAPDETVGAGPLTGFGAANGSLVIAAGSRVSAYRTAGAITQAPVDQSAPTLDGEARETELLAADVGVWSGAPTGYAYQWQRCDAGGAGCADLGGATGPDFKPGAGDVGATLRVRVVASNASGASAPVTSAATPVIAPAAPVNQAPPTISGLAQEARTLSAEPGTWSGSPTGYRYQWRRCGIVPPCVDIAGATDPDYTVVIADTNSQLQVRVVAQNPGGDSDPIDTALTAQVSRAPTLNQSPPTISGTAQEGQTLFAATGTWTNFPTGYRYQWFTCDAAGTDCPDIAGATQPSYVPRAADVGLDIGVEVIASTQSGDGPPADADLVGPVLGPSPSNLTAPTLSGSAQAGQTLTAGAGTWSGSPTAFAYAWVSCDNALDSCTAIPGATTSAYRIGPGDLGRRLVVGVVATNANGDSDAVPSAPTDPVVAAPPGLPANQVAPSIAGGARIGQTLTATPGAWTNAPTGYAFAWLHCPAATIGCVAIAGATSATYPVTGADVGRRLVVDVVAVNAGGRSPPAASPPTAVVPAAANDAFTITAARVRADGGLALTERAQDPGRYTAVATTAAASLASATAVYGVGATTATKPGAVVLTIKPNARGRRALRRHRKLVVRVRVTFQSALGGVPTRQARSFTIGPRHP